MVVDSFQASQEDVGDLCHGSVHQQMSRNADDSDDFVFGPAPQISNTRALTLWGSHAYGRWRTALQASYQVTSGFEPVDA